MAMLYVFLQCNYTKVPEKTKTLWTKATHSVQFLCCILVEFIHGVIDCCRSCLISWKGPRLSLCIG